MERKYSCGECDYEATYKSHLTKHIQSVHVSKNNTCEGCDYKAAGIYSQYIC